MAVDHQPEQAAHPTVLCTKEKTVTLIVDVTSDVICPWCYIGKRRLEKAIMAFSGRADVRMRWHPFELNPQMPNEGMNRREYRTAKFGSWERSLALDAQVMEVGRAEGISFAFDKAARTPNTLDSHRLIHLADQEGVQDAVVEALFRAYFTDGGDISHTPTLLDVVAGAGLDHDRAEAMLKDHNGIQSIREAEEQAQAAGVQGVPFFLVDNEIAISGAQDPSVFLAAFERAGAESPAPNEGSVCKVGAIGKASC
jgi:predicted DsbA family dithiol-disulfide isomerase